MLTSTTKPLLALVLLVASNGCATLIKGTGQSVLFKTEPPGAAINVDGRLVGKSPVSTRVSHGDPKTIEASLSGYRTESWILTTSVSGYTFLLFPFAFFFDAAMGSVYTLDQDVMLIRLEPTVQTIRQEMADADALIRATDTDGSQRLSPDAHNENLVR
jgi:hypothetical protein